MDLVERYYNNELEIGVFTSENENGENLIVEVSKEKLTIKTLQKNGWIRINVYHNDDEKTKEEYYDK